MPKELYEIKGFHKGLNTAMSNADTPDNIATNSLNTDPKSKYGRLSPIAKDSTVNKFIDSTDMMFIRHKTKGHVLIGFTITPNVPTSEYKTGFIKVVENFYEGDV